MDKQIKKTISIYQSVFEQRLNNIAWPIKCYWAKHFPITIVTTEDIEAAAIDFHKVYVHSKLSAFNDQELFCILAHEWAHRMVSPKSHAVGKRIVEAVANELGINFQLAQLISNPAIELIVDKSNCEIDSWNKKYHDGFIDCFTAFTRELELESNKDTDKDLLSFQKMMLALRLSNVSQTFLPPFISHYENKARLLTSLLFEDWMGCQDQSDPDHIKKIIRFSQSFMEWIPKKLLDQRKEYFNLLEQLMRQLDSLVSAIPASANMAESHTLRKSVGSNSSRRNNITYDEEIFDLGLVHEVTDYLLNQAHKSRQITGLWQPGNAFSKLDLKRSIRCSSKFIPGLTTRRKTDSSRIVKFESGQKIRLCLIIDDSGSMSGSEAKFSRSICEGINHFAAQKDIYLGLITFGCEIDVSFPPTRRYPKITKALSGLDGNLGGTNLLPALKDLNHYLESDNLITHAMLVTDASFSDWNDCKNTIHDIITRINMTVLLINSDPPEEVLNTFKDDQHAINFFKIDPTEIPNIAILEEIIR